MITEIQLPLCYPSPRARPIDDAAVKALASSITDGGLLNAITVRKVQKSRNGQMCDAYEVIAGMHRVKAFRRLQRETIPAVVLDVDDLHAELMLIDENLYRNDLSPAERHAALIRRKVLHEKIYGPAKAKGAHAANEAQGNAHDATAKLADAFTTETADAMGKSDRTIRREVQRGEALGEDALAKIARTSLDSGAEMDALIKLPEEKRQALIAKAAEGQEVSAKSEVQNLVQEGIRDALITEAPAAHMAGRVHPAGDNDFSPTPPWATRALVERVLRHLEREKVCKFQTAWEPACGEGHMAEVLREYFRSVVASDIDPKHGYAAVIGDFLSPDLSTPAGTYDWIITNPPFGENVLPFIKRALDLAGTGVAMFLQLRYLEGVERYQAVYRDQPPTLVAPFVERVPLLMGKYDPEASTTTAFMWLVWLEGAAPKPTFWIPDGCKAALTKPDDAERFTQKPVVKLVRPAPDPLPAPRAKRVAPTGDDYPELPTCLRRHS